MTRLFCVALSGRFFLRGVSKGVALGCLVVALSARGKKVCSFDFALARRAGSGKTPSWPERGLTGCAKVRQNFFAVTRAADCLRLELAHTSARLNTPLGTKTRNVSQQMIGHLTQFGKDLLPQDKLAVIEFKGNKPAINVPKDASYYILEKFKTKKTGFSELLGVNTAQYLEVNFSNITSFLEIGKLGGIKRLELAWCLKLENDSGLSEIKDHIEWLHIDTSRKFSPKKDLFELRNLKVFVPECVWPIR